MLQLSNPFLPAHLFAFPRKVRCRHVGPDTVASTFINRAAAGVGRAEGAHQGMPFRLQSSFKATVKPLEQHDLGLA